MRRWRHLPSKPFSLSDLQLQPNAIESPQHRHSVFAEAIRRTVVLDALTFILAAERSRRGCGWAIESSKVLWPDGFKPRLDDLLHPRLGGTGILVWCLGSDYGPVSC